MQDKIPDPGKKKMELKWLGLAVLILGLVVVLWFFWARPKKEMETHTQKIPPVEQKTEATPQPTKEEPYSTAVALPQALSPTSDPCDSARTDIQEFLGFLKENQHYQKTYGKQDPKVFFNSIVDTLSRKLPYMGNDQALYYMNEFHLFRLLGTKNIDLIKHILEEDISSTEIMLKNLYTWITLDECEVQDLKKPKKEVIAAYLRFLLELDTGKKYLQRRKKELNFLLRYYALMFSTKINISLTKETKVESYHFLKKFLSEYGDKLYLKEEYAKNLEEIGKSLK